MLFETELALALLDRFPVNPGHVLVVTRRHVASWFEATRDEQVAVLSALDRAREVVASRRQPDGFNIGVNVGTAAGQTVFHLHVHLIPRYRGDVADPRGGVRHVIPQRGNYAASPPPATSTRLSDAPDGPRLVRGGDDPLLPYLVEQFARAKDADLAVGFVLGSGVTRLEAHLQDVLSRGGRVRLITGDYLGVTDPDALVRLLDLDGGLALRVFETVAPDRPAWPGPTAAVSFHPKAYIFHLADGSGVAFVDGPFARSARATSSSTFTGRVRSIAPGRRRSRRPQVRSRRLRQRRRPGTSCGT